MDDRIDVTKRKPRRLRGTPALKFVNRFSLAVLTAATGIGVLINYTFPNIEDFKKKFGIDLTKPSEQELNKRSIFITTLGSQKTGEQILKIIEEQEKEQQQQ